MNEIPARTLARRRELSRAFLSGNGIEIGALHHPLALGPRARVRYVDRHDVDGLRLHYPELRDFDLVAVDVIDDGETLSSFRDGELDFLIANHFLEHTENPIGTIRNHLCKVRPGGRLYFAVPNKHDSFDRERALTTFDHLVADDRDGPERSRVDHFREWARVVEKRADLSDIEARVNDLMAANYSIHFHVWDARSFNDFLDRAGVLLGNTFEVEHFSVNGSEIVAVLKKRGRVDSEDRSRAPRGSRKLSRLLSAHWGDRKGELRNLRTALAQALSRSLRRRAS